LPLSAHTVILFSKPSFDRQQAASRDDVRMPNELLEDAPQVRHLIAPVQLGFLARFITLPVFLLEHDSFQ
jgi:hypothetical protein